MKLGARSLIFRENLYVAPRISAKLVAMSPVLVTQHVAQQAQFAANAVSASLPELASAGRAALQELVAFLASGGQALPTQGIASASSAVAVDVAADATLNSLSPSVSPLNTSMAADPIQEPLSSIRDQFKKQLGHSMTHLAELPDEQRRSSGRSWGVFSESPLRELAVPSKKRKPFVVL